MSHSRKNLAKFGINVHKSSCKAPVIIVKFQLNLNFLDRFSLNPRILKFIKILPVVAELFRWNGRTDERTDRHNEAFRSIANALENKRTRRCLFNSYAVFSMIHKHRPPLLISCSISHRHLRLNKRGLSPCSTFTSTEYTGFRSALSRNPVQGKIMP
jgi:hypothetical protein